MSKPVVVRLGLPPRELHPNARKHWRAKIKPKQQARVQAWLNASIAVQKRIDVPFAKAVWRADWTFSDKRSRHDDDNLTAWLKAYLDGIADAGIVANDRDLTFGGHSCRYGGLPEVVLTIEAVKPLDTIRRGE